MKKHKEHSAPLTALLTLLALSPFAHAQVTAVDFGGDYNDNKTAGSWAAALVYENGDFDGDTLADDRRGYNPMDATIPGYKDDKGVGTNIHFDLGCQVTYFDKTDADPAARNLLLEGGP